MPAPINIIVRCSGERTEKKCIELAEAQGKVHVIKAYPFGECLRQSYRLGAKFTAQKWVPMIDGDVLLINGTINRAIKYLNAQHRKVFCLDGKTKDNILRCVRRAGIHIFRRALLQEAMHYIDDNELKPESTVRRAMGRRGYITVVGQVVFGYHDYEQYYCDIWKKAFCQSQKLRKLIHRKNIKATWKKLAVKNPEFKIVLAAHAAAEKYNQPIVIDRRCDYGANEGLEKLGLKERGEYGR